ncbi:hypothetical protein ACE8EZ_11390 [Pantoea deleyi]|uniref:hypothetical protein n=1 Tax=Pantoea deleyi TaxID=470932 RepID=UPI0035D435A9
MSPQYLDKINILTSLLEKSPLYVLMAVVILTVCAIFLRMAKDLKFEHVFRHTLNNKIRFIKNEIAEGILEEEKEHLKQCYITLLNQKIYGIKNKTMQKEVINIIDKSVEIKDFKYFSIHQYILSINDEGQLFFSKSKIKARAMDAFALLFLGLLMLALGFWIIYQGSLFGLVACLLGITLYFGGLFHFPASRHMRKRAEKEIADYYQRNHTFSVPLN